MHWESSSHERAAGGATVVVAVRAVELYSLLDKRIDRWSAHVRIVIANVVPADLKHRRNRAHEQALSTRRGTYVITHDVQNMWHRCSAANHGEHTHLC